MPIIKKYANIKEVSEYTGLAVKTLYDWAANGMIPSIKAGKKVLFDLADVDAALGRMRRNIRPQVKEAEEKSDEIISSVERMTDSKHGKSAPETSEAKEYNSGQQHNQRNLSD
jgi:excisionase family DNA binding protein